jgi:cytochrome oxidase Cu insertion factor (SCO1/SenC/PrrC family)
MNDAMRKADNAAGPRRTPEPGSILPHVIAIAIVVLASFAAFKLWQVREFEQSRGEAIALHEVGPPLTEFELTERSGKPFRSNDMKGKVWVATYFFATCPGNCIRLNQNIKFMHNLPELTDATWVSITCDPDNDTVEALAKYAEQWNADPERWLFTRADLDYTKRVARGMNLFLERKGHQDYAIVIDKTGKIRGMYDATSKSQCERLHTKLLECLAEDPPKDLAATKDNSQEGAVEKKSI